MKKASHWRTIKQIARKRRDLIVWASLPPGSSVLPRTHSRSSSRPSPLHQPFLPPTSHISRWTIHSLRHPESIGLPSPRPWQSDASPKSSRPYRSSICLGTVPVPVQGMTFRVQKEYITAKEIRYLFLSSNKRLIMEFHLYFSNNVTPHL